YQSWDADGQKTASDFLAWIKGCILGDIPVAIGIYMNSSIFDDLEGEGTLDYDHEVPVIGIESKHPLSATSYHDDDCIVFSDNGVYTPNSSQPFIFKYSFHSFQRTRDKANKKGGPPYSLAKDRPNYGIALAGIESDGSTLPIRVATSPNFE